MSKSPGDSNYSQARRSLEHIAPLGFAFTLPIFPLWLIFTLSVLAIFYGAFGSKVVSKNTFRREEASRGYSVGKIAYGLSVFILLLLFYRQMYVVAGAWAIMALGDSSATLAGKAFGSAKLPWNSEKSWAGTAAFILVGTLGAFALLWYTFILSGQPATDALQMLAGAALAAAVCGITESLKLPVNDNFTVPLTAGVILFFYFRNLIG